MMRDGINFKDKSLNFPSCLFCLLYVPFARVPMRHLANYTWISLLVVFSAYVYASGTEVTQTKEYFEKEIRRIEWRYEENIHQMEKDKTDIEDLSQEIY